MRAAPVTHDYMEELNMDEARSERPAIIHPVVKHSLNLRKIGGSDVAALLGLDPFGKGPRDVYVRIDEGHSQESTWRMRRGKRHERPISEDYCDKYNAKVEWFETSFEPRDREWQRFSPDVRILKREGVAGGSIADVKRYARALDFLGEPGTDEIGNYELVQLHYYMEGVAHLFGETPTHGVLIVDDLATNDVLEYVVPYNPELAGMLVEEAERFWVDHVLPRKPPAMGGSSNLCRWLEKKYPKAKQPPRQATPIEVALAERWRSLNVEAEKIEDEIDVIKNQLRESVQDAQAIKGDFGTISWSDIPEGEVSYFRKAYRRFAPYFKKRK